MVTGIEPIRYQTKYRPKEYQKLPSKKPLGDMFAVILIRLMLRRCSYTLLSSMSKYVAMIIVNAYVVRLHITYFLCRL